MAHTIGKDKRAATSARPSAASRAKAAGTRATRQVSPVDTTPDQELAVAGTNADDEDVDIVLAEDDEEDDLRLEGREVALSESEARGIARHEAAPVRRGGPLWAIVRLLLAVPILGSALRGAYASYQELRKVTAPTPREAWNMTLVVLAMSAVVAIILGAADLGLIRLLSWIVTGAY